MRTGKARHVDVKLQEGPFDGNTIKMSTGQVATLVFRIKGGEYGCYERPVGGKKAYWNPEEISA